MRAALLLALLLIPAAAALSPLEASSMEARVLITNTVAFEPQGSTYRVDDAEARLSWYPRPDPLQEVLSLETNPQSEGGEALLFSWTRPARTETLEVSARIRTKNAVVPVRERIPFPLQQIPPELERYLLAGDITDQNHGIERLAQELAAGKDDAYEIAYALADWTTTNVEYSLASLGQPAIQRSSQVLASRQGKCDELTALFISLNRALGIPARFVAGYAYTNSDLLQEEWGGHGWAEVWLPGAGWVPFDVTYGEYGYLDAGHVRLKVAPDAKETSIDYRASGSGFDLRTEPLDIYVTPIELRAHADPRIEISLDAPYRTVGFGSVVLILATVRNTKDYYVATRLDLSQTTRSQMLSDNYANLLLRPRETRTVPFLVRIEDELDHGYRYEFPFRLSSRLGEEETITIDVEPRGQIYSEGDFARVLESYAEAPAAQVPFAITCDRQTGYVGEELVHTCVIDGPAGDSVSVCADACEGVQVIGGEFALRATHSDAGVHTQRYVATMLGKQAPFFVTGRAVRESEVRLQVSAPASMTPREEAVVTVHLNQSGALATNVTVVLDTRRAVAREQVESLPARVDFTMPGNALRPGENVLEARVSYVDELGTPGEASGTAIVALTDATLADRVAFALTDFGAWVADLFS